MVERIEKVQYVAPPLTSTREPWETLFLTGPAEFLPRTIISELKKVPVWPAVFSDDYMDSYKRMDYPIRALPALRCYIDTYRKDSETGYINGLVNVELIFPPNIVRGELEQIPATFSSAMLQQFRSHIFFAAVAEQVPGLNELGRNFDVDKSLAFEWQGGTDNETLCPLVQILLNFRLLLEEWDRYATEDNREKDTPFLRTLGNLTDLRALIQGVNDLGEPEVSTTTIAMSPGES